MSSVELRDVMADFGRLIGHVEETGERVRITDGGESAGVLLPAAELAELEHFAQRVPGAPRPRPRTVQESPLGPEKQGPYVRYLHLFNVLVFGEAAGWTWLGYHDFGNAFSCSLDPPPSQEITLTAIAAKAIYDFHYSKDGVHQNPSPVEDCADARPEMYELIWYTPGETPFDPSAPLAFLNPYIRRAEKETEWTDGISLFFAGLERALGLSLPREAITSGHVRCAYPAHR